MRKNISIDFETFSECDLSKSGAWKYSMHCTTEILCMAYSIDGGGVKLLDFYFGDSIYDDPELASKLLREDYCIRAWNANFEIALWESVGIKKLGFPSVNIYRWVDDMAISAYFAFPLSLKSAGDALGLSIEHLKDRKGTLLINKFSKLKKVKGKGYVRCLPEDYRDDYIDFKNYCKQDVTAQMSAVNALPKSYLPANEQRIWAIDSCVNKKGVLIDIDLVEGALKLIQKFKVIEEQKLTGITSGYVNSGKEVKKIMTWLSSNGCAVDNLQKKTLENLDVSNFTENAREVIQIRRNLSMSSTSKFKAMKDAICDDGRIRGCIQYYGASRTGRFSGRIIQVQNLPRGSNEYDHNTMRGFITEANYDAFSKFDMNLMLSSAIRPSIMSPKVFGIVDYASIENRVLAWVAGDRKTLEDFVKGNDIYKRMASSLFNVDYDDVTKPQRTVGKVIVLGSGYGMSGKTFHKHANENFNLNISIEEANNYINVYRETFIKNKKLWGDVDTASKKAVRYAGTAVTVKNGYCTIIFKMIDGNLYCHLPSGRNLCYPRASLKYEEYRENIVFKTKLNANWCDTRTYGAKLVENICQAISRDILTDALIKLHDNDYVITMHVHDEIVCELREGQSVDDQMSLMLEKSDWASTLPLAAECFESKHYCK